MSTNSSNDTQETQKDIQTVTTRETTTGQGITEEKISNNAKIILLALFSLVGFIVGLGSWVVITKPEVTTEVLTIIFSSAITGCFTLGGVLINAIWGK